MRAALLTISTSRSAAGAHDESGAALAAFATGLGLQIAGREIVRDERAEIESRLKHWSDRDPVDLILTSGGTGLSPDDVTPEATAAVLERDAPGIAEAIRAASRPHTSHWMLSRGTAGTRGRTLIVNFPGSPRSIEQTGAELAPALPHALALLAGENPGHRG